jgi:TonB family protein
MMHLLIAASLVMFLNGAQADSQRRASLSSGHIAPPLKVCGPKVSPPCGTAPVLLKSKDPKYSKEARKNKVQGITVLWLIVGEDGRPHDIKVARSLGFGLDQEAIKAVEKWTFKPSTLDGHPVPVQINVQVNFHLY